METIDPLPMRSRVDSNVLGKNRTIASLTLARATVPASPSLLPDMNARDRIFLSERTGAKTTMRRPMNPASRRLRRSLRRPLCLPLSRAGCGVARDRRGRISDRRAGTIPPAGPRHGYPTAIAIKDAKIVAAPGKVHDPGTIVVRRGVIEAVGPARRSASPSTPR